MRVSSRGGGPTARAVSLREQTLLVCALIGAAQMTWGVVVPVLPSFEERFGISIALLGVVVAAFGVGRILGNLPAGILFARLDARRMVRVTAIGLSLVTASTALAQDVVALIVLRTLTGVLGGATVTLCFAVLFRGAPAASRGRVISIATVVQLGAAALGSLLGGLVLQTLGAGFVFPVAAVPLLLVLVWDALRPAAHYWSGPDTRAGTGPHAERGAEPESEPAAKRDDTGTPARDAGVRPQPVAPPAASPPGRLLAGLLAVTFALFVVRFAGEQGLIPLLAYSDAGLDPIQLGATLAAGTVVSIAALPLVGRWLDRGARALPALLAAGAAAIALVSLGALTGAGFVVGVIVVTVASSILGVVPGVVTAERFPPARIGFVVGLTRTTGDIGAALGPLIAFGLADALDPAAALWLLGALLAVSGAAFAAVVAGRPRSGRLRS